ncbi:hypothetical protein CSO01_29760 [Cellulomonas soli]|uniref:TadE-like domain-containing protein n=1 Tax=Cellulomonas soli TaxID=931535 RepID=A0A512PGF0_9CELL|nr:hypothetical protein CSO01_29760 [Cellulomonas soli]
MSPARRGPTRAVALPLDEPGDRGSVTAELAVALPAVVVLLLVVLGVVHASSVRWQCADGARAGARSAALGESDAVVVQTARRAAGGAASVEVVRDGEWVTVTVGRAVTGWDAVPLDVQAQAVGRSEP